MRTRYRHPAAILFWLACAGVTMLAADWPHWRGSGRDRSRGRSRRCPVRWSATENVAWKAPLGRRRCLDPHRQRRSRLRHLAGRGGRQARREPSRAWSRAATRRRRESARSTPARAAADAGKTFFVVEAFSRADGKRLWERRIEAEGTLTPVHDKHNLASPSPVTDGSRVYALVRHRPDRRAQSRRHARLAASPRQGDCPVRHPVGTRELAGSLRRSADPALRSRAGVVHPRARQADRQGAMEGRSRQGPLVLQHAARRRRLRSARS